MGDLEALTEYQIQDMYYLRRITSLGDRFPIRVQQDIYSHTGIKLVGAGTHIGSSHHEKLLRHKLLPSLDHALGIENAVSSPSLMEAARVLLEVSGACPAFMRESLPERPALMDVLAQIPLPPPIAFKLTVMRETQADLFHRSLFISLVCAHAGMRLGLEEQQVIRLATAALLHDIGLMHVDPQLLAPEHRMTDLERRHLYTHPITAWLILKNCQEYSPEVLQGVLQHHERLDGSGYPSGLQTEDTGLFGRLIGMAEIVASCYLRHRLQSSRTSLETILKLNQQQYGAGLLHAFKPFYDQGTGHSSDEFPTQVDLERLRPRFVCMVTAFASWNAIKTQLTPDHAMCRFLRDRMSCMRREATAAGLSPDLNVNDLMIHHQDPQSCEEALVVLNEMRWQIRNLFR